MTPPIPRKMVAPLHSVVAPEKVSWRWGKEGAKCVSEGAKIKKIAGNIADFCIFVLLRGK